MSRGPATPNYILRGHEQPVHALAFFRSNSFLASGDSNGWVLIWSLSSKRPAAAWKAHEGGITGLKDWPGHGLITHGRDHKLRVWQLQLDSTSETVVKLPSDGIVAEQSAQPWLLHSLDISALNFCSFAICERQDTENINHSHLLIASPNGLDSGGIDLFHLPSQHRVSQLSSDKHTNTGMVMAVSIFDKPEVNILYVLSAYEEGSVMVHCHEGGLHPNRNNWHKLAVCRVHTQPVLSLALSPEQDYLITSSADSRIVKLDLSNLSLSGQFDLHSKTIDTKHAGQQGLSIRSDGKIFTTAGWDSRVRIYSTKTLKELAVLKWHKEGCYSTAFAEIDPAVEISRQNVSSDITTGTVATSALDVIKQERRMKAQKTHWLAVGAKDNKISLWDVY